MEQAKIQRYKQARCLFTPFYDVINRQRKQTSEFELFDNF